MRREKVIPIPSILVELVNDYEKKHGIKNGEYLFKNKNPADIRTLIRLRADFAYIFFHR